MWIKCGKWKMASVFHTCRRCGRPLYCKTRSYCGALKSLHDSTVISFITPQHAPNQTWTLTILPLVCRFVAGAEVGGGFNSISGVVGVLKWNKFGVWEQWKEGGYTGDYWEKWRERQVQTCEGFRGAAGNPKEAEQDTVVWKSVAPFLISYFWYVCVKLVNVSDQRNLNIRQKWHN